MNTERKQAAKILADYNRSLEAEVKARTIELARINDRLAEEITERRQSEQRWFFRTYSAKILGEISIISG
jgi:C4-dicarboxylate-specific signal transduction histidine kinase